MKCAACGEEIIVDRLVAYDQEKQIVTRVYPQGYLEPSAKMRSIDHEEGTVLLLGEPHIIVGDRAFHIRCYKEVIYERQ